MGNRSMKSTASDPSLSRRPAREWLAFVTGTVLAVLLLAGPGSAAAQAGSEGEYSIKAAFLYNFAKFAEWPPSVFDDASGPLVICVLGPDPFGSALDEIEGKGVGRRAISIRRVRSPLEIGQCHIVFISNALAAEARTICGALGQAPVLTVSDIDGFAQTGGMIGLTTVDNRIRFQINLKAAENAGLKLSSQLLKLATIVESSP
jgi:hypothetical protein